MAMLLVDASMAGQHAIRPLPSSYQHNTPDCTCRTLRTQTRALHMRASQPPSRMHTRLLHTGTCGTSLPLRWQSRAR